MSMSLELVHTLRIFVMNLSPPFSITSYSGDQPRVIFALVALSHWSRMSSITDFLSAISLFHSCNLLNDPWLWLEWCYMYLGITVINGSTLYHVRVDFAIARRHVHPNKVVKDSYFYMMFGWMLRFDRMIGQEIFLCWLSVSANNIREIIIVLVLKKVQYCFKNLCELVRLRSIFCDWKVRNGIVFYFFYGWISSKSAVYPIAIEIAAVGVLWASMACLAISGDRTLFGVFLEHDDIKFVLSKFMCWFGSFLVTVIFPFVNPDPRLIMLKYLVAECMIRSMSYHDNKQRSYNEYNANSNYYFWLR